MFGLERLGVLKRPRKSALKHSNHGTVKFMQLLIRHLVLRSGPYAEEHFLILGVTVKPRYLAMHATQPSLSWVKVQTTLSKTELCWRDVWKNIQILMKRLSDMTKCGGHTPTEWFEVLRTTHRDSITRRFQMKSLLMILLIESGSPMR